MRSGNRTCACPLPRHSGTPAACKGRAAIIVRNEALWTGQVDPVGGMRASWNRRVSRDMERIFGARPGERLDGPAGPPLARTPDAVIPLVGEATESWPRTLIVTSVAAMAGVLLLSGAVWIM